MRSATEGTSGPGAATRYVERLWVPAGWWAFTLFVVASMWFAYAYAVRAPWVHGAGALLAALAVAGLLAFGRLALVVDGDGLRAGHDRLPWSAIGTVTVLSPAQARALRGPLADATARLVVRPYLSRAVCVELTGTARPEPYWYLATRHPERLAAALTGSGLTGSGITGPAG